MLVLEGTLGYLSRDRKGQPVSCPGFREVCCPLGSLTEFKRMVSTDCFILQSGKLRHSEGKHLAQGHGGLVAEPGSEPRAPLLYFHLLLGPPHLMSVSVSVQLYP